MRKTNYYTQSLAVLKEIHQKFPSYNMGRNIITALDGWDAWGISDKEFLNALIKYQAELEYDIPHTFDDVEGIIKDGMSVGKTLFEDDEEDDEHFS